MPRLKNAARALAYSAAWVVGGAAAVLCVFNVILAAIQWAAPRFGGPATALVGMGALLFVIVAFIVYGKLEENEAMERIMRDRSR